MRLPVFDTGPYPLILGVDWLQTAHASLNFSDNTLSLPSPSSGPVLSSSPISRPSLSLRPTPSLSSSVRPSLRSPPSRPGLATAAYAPFRHLNPVSYSVPFARFRPPLTTPAASAPPIFVSSSAAASASPPASNATPSMTHADWVARAMSRLPKILHRFESIFSDTGANTLPPHRPGYDFEIDLQPDTTPPFGPLYALSQNENEALRKYLDQMLANGFIQPSKSPAASPFLFAAKKGGELRPCVDYRKLNAITVKNRYPIPLTQQLVDRVRGCTVFSKIDLKNAYNLLRVAAGHEWKTAFRTRFGLFEYKVMPFGLTNAPAAFQSFIQHVLSRWLDTHVVVYLDDILLFSRSEEEHTELLRDVFQALSSAGLFANPKKCEFFVQETEFLGFLLSTTGLAADPSKLDTIRDWPTPRSVTDVRAFLGHAGFYRRFVDDYSRIALPLTRLTRTGPGSSSFSWSPAAQLAFDTLKSRFLSPPVLRHFNFESPSVLYVDASDFAVGAVLAQPDPATGVLHPCAFYSRQFLDAEINYKVYDKEMTAIMAALDHWRSWLIGSDHKLLILSDHRNLEYFTTTQQLNRRQAGWSEKLQDYNFSIVHVPGARNWADGPSRRPDYAVRKGDVLHLGQYQILLEPSTLSASLPPSSSASLSQISAAVPSLAFASTIPVVALTGCARGNAVTLAPLVSSSARPQLLDDIKRAQQSDAAAQNALLSDDPLYERRNDVVMYRDRVYIPPSGDLRQRVVAAVHDSLPAGHPGPARTIELLRRTHDFPGSRRFVRAYVRSCDTCQRAKVATHAPYGLLQPNDVPTRPWQHIAMDFITKLPVSNGFDSVWVVVDRFSKMSHFIPCHETTTAPQLAWMFLQHIFRLHGLPSTIISDRGSVFTSQFWTSVLNLVGVEPRHSTAYHPQTDGQTERVNALLENYLRSFCSYQQDDWSSLLSFAEFSYNNSQSATTQKTPFQAVYGFHPSFLASSFPASDVPAADDLVSTINHIHQELRLEIQHAQEQQRRFYDRHRTPPPQLQVGQHVWLLRRNIKTTRPMDKLDHKRLGPFVIEQRVSENAYRLRLPPNLSRLHPVFNIQLLEPYIASPGSMNARPTPQQLRVQLNDADAHDLPWRPVQQILDVRQIGNRFDYLLRWHGLDPSEDSWRTYSDLSTSLEDLLRLFHRRNPAKPCPPSLSRPPAPQPPPPQPRAPLSAPAPPAAPPPTTTLLHPPPPGPSFSSTTRRLPTSAPSPLHPSAARPSTSAPPPLPPSATVHPTSSSATLPPHFPVSRSFPPSSASSLPPSLPAPTAPLPSAFPPAEPTPSALASPAASVPPPPAPSPPPPTAPTAHYRLRRAPRLNYRE
ncbi:hypothetical protein CF326_g6075 [Tilletia indica]|nr:hypothetical protein CF326_g6075 [Tilletia indica]